MIHRLILTVYDSGIIGKHLKRSILTEFNDVEIIEAASFEEGKKLLSQRSFNVIISCFGSDNLNNNRIWQAKRDNKLNYKTPLLILNLSEGFDQEDFIKENEDVRYLITPFSTADLKNEINKVSDPKKLRSEERYNIPGVKVDLKGESSHYSGEVLNFSSKGICANIKIHVEGKVLDFLDIKLEFPEEFNNLTFLGIKSRMIKFKIIEKDYFGIPDNAQVVCEFLEFTPKAEKKWKEFIDKFKEDRAGRLI